MIVRQTASLSIVCPGTPVARSRQTRAAWWATWKRPAASDSGKCPSITWLMIACFCCSPNRTAFGRAGAALGAGFPAGYVLVGTDDPSNFADDVRCDPSGSFYLAVRESVAPFHRRPGWVCSRQSKKQHRCRVEYENVNRRNQHYRNILRESSPGGSHDRSPSSQARAARLGRSPPVPVLLTDVGTEQSIPGRPADNPESAGKPVTACRDRQRRWQSGETTCLN